MGRGKGERGKIEPERLSKVVYKKVLAFLPFTSEAVSVTQRSFCIDEHLSEMAIVPA